jgi:hypothetical protein
VNFNALIKTISGVHINAQQQAFLVASAFLKTPEWCKFKEGKKHRPIGHALQPDAEVVPLWSSISYAMILNEVIKLKGDLLYAKSSINVGIRKLLLKCCVFKEALVNKYMTLRNWLIGCYIVEYEQNGEDKQKYGSKILEKIATASKAHNIKGLSISNLKLFKQFYLSYPQLAAVAEQHFIVSPISQTRLANSKKK